MSCTSISAGRDFICDNNNLGGLEAIYIFPYQDDLVDRITTDSDDAITALVDTNVAVTGFEFILKEDGNTFEEASETSRENGTSFHTQTLTVSLKKQDAASRKQLQLLTYGRPHVIVKDSNNTYRLMGLEFGTDATVAATSGGALADMSGYTITFEASEREMAHFVDANAMNFGAGSDTEFNVSSTKIS